MHELGIVFHIIDTIEDVAKEQNLLKVHSVTLSVGEVSTVVPSYLGDCWKWAVDRSKLMKGCLLKNEIIPAVTYCEDCGKTYETVKHGKICPYCHSENTYLLSGNEVEIKEIESV